MLWPEFVGGAYRSRSENIAADVCINLYPEVTESEGAKKATLIGTPGLNILLSLASAGCRGIFSQDDTTIAVVGDIIYTVDIAQASATSIGTIADDGLAASMACNGRGGEQLVIVAGGQLKVVTLTTNAVSAAIALPLTNAPTVVVFINGYFVLQEENSVRRWFSALENGTSWDALDFFATSQTSDNGVGLVAIHDRLWCLGSTTSSLYYDSGDADNPFVPYPGSVILTGLVSPSALTILGESVLWLAESDQGSRQIVMATGSQPQTISTPAIEFALGRYARVDDCEAYSYEQEGHSFAWFTFPSGDETWVFDLKTNQWHQRESWDEATGTSHHWRARGLCQSGAKLVTGDWTTGELYTLDLDVFTDACGVLRRVRRAPYLSSENQWLTISRVELGIEAGVGLTTGQGSDPKVMLSVSRDSGHTWGPVVTALLGPLGTYQTSAIWRRLGRVRADRLVLEVSQTDPVKTIWGPGLFIRATPGSGNL